MYIDGSTSPGMEQRIAMAYCMMDSEAIGVMIPGVKTMITKVDCHRKMAKGVF